VLGDRHELHVGEAEAGDVVGQLLGQLAVGQAVAPGAEVELIDRHRRGHGLALVAAGHPLVVAPRVGGGEHDAVGARRGQGRERERVGLERERPLRGDQLVLVLHPSRDPGHEQLPHPGSAEQSHRVQAAVPAIELTHHPHGAGVGRPDRERGPGHAVEGALVGAELLPQPLVGGLADQVLVDLPDRGQEPVGVVDGEAAVPVGDLEPVGGDVAAWKHDLE
jgi:hypothetical protein